MSVFSSDVIGRRNVTQMALRTHLVYGWVERQACPCKFPFGIAFLDLSKCILCFFVALNVCPHKDGTVTPQWRLPVTHMAKVLKCRKLFTTYWLHRHLSCKDKSIHFVKVGSFVIWISPRDRKGKERKGTKNGIARNSVVFQPCRTAFISKWKTNASLIFLL